MSKYIVTSDSYFQPYSYDEMIKPLQQMTEAHNAAADVYDQLSMETEALGRYISQNEDDEMARGMYENYMNKLNTLQENLWNRGYSFGTRKDISSARAAYAKDITRLDTAIKTRQAQSDKFWDYAHTHPEAVMGFDPGLSGLDNYLKDDNYGKNWFTYNGKQFAEEVATDLSARAAGLQQSYIDRGMKVPGYLEYVINEGFSNSQVDKGGELARKLVNGEQVNMKDYDEVHQLIAGVLIDHLNKTGASPGEGGNISKDQFDRLFNFGMYGASQSVKAPKRQMLGDKQWDYDRSIDKMDYEHQLKLEEMGQKFMYDHPEYFTGNGVFGAGMYGLNPPADGTSRYIGDEQTAFEMNKVMSGLGLDYSKSKNIVYDGQPIEIHNVDEADQLLDYLGKAQIVKQFGWDPEMGVPGTNPTKDKQVAIRGYAIDEYGRKTEELRMIETADPGEKKDLRKLFSNEAWMKDKNYEPLVVLRYNRQKGKDEIDNDRTMELNKLYYMYSNNKKSLAEQNKDNPDFDINKFTVTGDTRKKLYNDGSLNIPIGTPINEAIAAKVSSNFQGWTTPTTIVDGTNKDELKRYATHMQNYYANNVAGKDVSKLGNDNSFAFYPVVGGKISDKPVYDVTKILGAKGSASNPQLDFNGLIGIQATPEDIIHHNKIEFLGDGSQWFAANPGWAGNVISGIVSALRMPFDVKINDDTVRLDDKGVLNYLMIPLEDPSRVLRMSDRDQARWCEIAQQYLGKYHDFEIRDNNDKVVERITPKEILMDMSVDGYKADLRNAIQRYLDVGFSNPEAFYDSIEKLQKKLNK